MEYKVQHNTARSLEDANPFGRLRTGISSQLSAILEGKTNRSMPDFSYLILLKYSTPGCMEMGVTFKS